MISTKPAFHTDINPAVLMTTSIIENDYLKVTFIESDDKSNIGIVYQINLS